MQRFIWLMRAAVAGKRKYDAERTERGGREGGHEAWRGKRGRFWGVREDETMDAVAIYRLTGIYATAFPLANTGHVSISGRCN